MDFEQRVILKPGKQREIVEQYVRIHGSIKKAAKILGIGRNTLSAYKNGRYKSMPLEIVEKIVEETGHNLEELVEERVMLGELRCEALRKWREENPERLRQIQMRGVQKLKEMYKDDPSKMTEKAREALRKKYGENCYSIIGKMGREKAIKLYGEKALKEMYKKGYEKLVREHGEEEAKRILRKRLESGLKKKYGENWREVVKKLAVLAWMRKYPEDWREKLAERARERLRRRYGNNWPYVLSLVSWHAKLKKRGGGRKELLPILEKLVSVIKRGGTLEDLLEGESPDGKLAQFLIEKYGTISKAFGVNLKQEDFSMFLRVYFLVRDNPGITEGELGERLGVPKKEVRRIIYKMNRFFVGKVKSGSESRWWVKKHLFSENLYKSSAYLVYDKKLKSLLHRKVELRGVVKESI